MSQILQNFLQWRKKLHYSHLRPPLKLVVHAYYGASTSLPIVLDSKIKSTCTWLKYPSTFQLLSSTFQVHMYFYNFN